MTFLISMLTTNVYAKNCKKGYKYDSKYDLCLPANKHTCEQDPRTTYSKSTDCSSGESCNFKTRIPKKMNFNYCL